MCNYKVLWLDDDFIGPASFNSDDLVNARRQNFMDDVDQLEKIGFSIDPAKNINEFKEKFGKNKYHAVILDILDMNPQDSSDESALPEALKLLVKAPVLTYIYSSNPNKPGHKDTIKAFELTDHAISKADGIMELGDKLKAELDKELYYYRGHEECLSLLNNGYLSTDDQITSILKNIEDDTYLPFNDMRQVLENMLETLTQVGVIPSHIGTSDTFKTFNQRMNYITTECKTKISKGNEIVDWKSPCVPYCDCRHEIKWVLDFMGNITNRYSHYQDVSPNYLLSGDLMAEYYLSIRKIVYEAFFVSMKWFNGYMINKT